MTWLRDRAVQILGVLCLAGQGTLIFVGSRGRLEPSLELPWLFLIFTVLLAVSLAWSLRQARAATYSSPSRVFISGLVLVLSLGILLASSVVQLGTPAKGLLQENPGSSDNVGGRVKTARLDLQQLPETLAALQVKIQAEFGTLAGPAEGGDLFRFLQRWPDIWNRDFSGAEALPLEMVLHRGDEALAWTSGARPLVGGPGSRQADRAHEIQLRETKGNWQLIHRSILTRGNSEGSGGGSGPDIGLEIQIPLPGDSPDGRWSGTWVQVVPVALAPVVVNPQGNAVPRLALTDSRGELGVLVQAHPDLAPGRHSVRQSRWMLALGLGWFITLLFSLRLFLGGKGFLAGLWLGRALLAAVEYLRWVGSAFPDNHIPAAPDQLISLVGPAYFATPFGSGWFASTADALFSALVLGATVWALLRFQNLVGLDRRGPLDLRPFWGLGQGPFSGLVFGLVACTVLLGLRFFAGLVAENANPRLIGQGVSLSFLSFWGLHLVLMIISFSCHSLLAGWAGRLPWPGRDRLGPWLWGGAVVGLLGGGFFLLVPERWWGLPLLAMVLVMSLWAIAPAISSRPKFLRRFAWPAVLLLAVVWNYTALREVYDRAERSWLEGKGGVISGSGEDWTRYLLEDALRGMQASEGPHTAGSPRAGIWQDEAAYQLWSGSPLRDLGYACLVEIHGNDNDEESLFATGFLRDNQYDVLNRGLWTDGNGEPTEDFAGPAFQVERRMYPAGEEEVLAARIPRLGPAGWIHVELPLRSWRVSTLLADLRGEIPVEGGYQPRSEVDRPILLLHGWDDGWLGTGDPGFSGLATRNQIQQLKSGQLQWARLNRGQEKWLCRWTPLADEVARQSGEGFLLGVRQPTGSDNLLDLSRTMLLNLVLFFLAYALIQLFRGLGPVATLPPDGQPDRLVWRWLPGFQEKFLAGYLLLGLLLLLAVGASVDRVGYERVRNESREQTGRGQGQAVTQLRNLLVEQAKSFASSDYIADLLLGELTGQRPAGFQNFRQAMVFAADGQLLLDETLSDLSQEEAGEILRAGRANPLLIIRDDQKIFAATVIPIQLGFSVQEARAGADSLGAFPGDEIDTGFFLYRQKLDQQLLGSLADLVQGQATLRLDGQPALASHPGPIFSGHAPLLADPLVMASVLDHPGGPGVFAQPGRPFAFRGSQPLPSFTRNENGQLVRQHLPGILSLAFPDRERQYGSQRRETALFLAGLANLILLTALLLALVMSWNLFRPLRVLLTATRSLAEGDFEAPLPDEGRDEVGRLTEAFGTMRSQLRTARARLAAREQFLTTVLDQVTVGVAVIDKDGLVVALNPAGKNILGDFLPGLDEQQGVRALLKIFQEMGRGQASWGGELRSPDGRHTLRGARAPLQLPSGEPDTLLVYEDVTEFLQTKKMAINAELARQVAHEIKNPLTPIQLSVQLLDQAWRDKHPQLDSIMAETVQRVLDQVNLLRSIASEFSLLGRPDTLELENLDLEKITAEVVASYSGRADGLAGAFAVNIAPAEMPQVRGEKDALLKILGNLMQNSLDAARVENPLQIDISFTADTAGVTLIWQDNGEGLAAEVADRLFDPYFSTKSKGTGLGLAICRNLAGRMGGAMTLTNRENGPGARATLTLPRA